MIKAAFSILSTWAMCVSMGTMLLSPCIVFGLDQVPKPVPRWLQGYDIRPEFIPIEKKSVGTILNLEGRIIIIHQETDEAFFGKAGDPFFEGDLIATLEDTVCRIQFSTRDSASLSANSILIIDEYLDARSERKKSAVLSMKAGRIFFYVLRLLGYRDIGFQVNTPSSVAAVRGTKFGLHVYESTNPKTGDVAFFTNGYCADGLVEIDGLPVHEGELYRSATGEVRPAPAAYLNQFHAALNLPLPAPTLISSAKRKEAPADDMRSVLLEQNATHTDNVQEVRHLDRVRQETGTDPRPLPEPPVIEPPAQPEEPPVSEPPAQPEEPPVSEPPAQPEEPPVNEPPARPEEPPVIEPPARPEEPPVIEPPGKPDRPPVQDDDRDDDFDHDDDDDDKEKR